MMHADRSRSLQSRQLRIAGNINGALTIMMDIVTKSDWGRGDPIRMANTARTTLKGCTRHEIRMEYHGSGRKLVNSLVPEVLRRRAASSAVRPLRVITKFIDSAAVG